MKYLSDSDEAGYEDSTQEHILREIAYQLERIADALEKKE
jgi:hypothetical protein